MATQPNDPPRTEPNPGPLHKGFANASLSDEAIADLKDFLDASTNHNVQIPLATKPDS